MANIIHVNGQKENESASSEMFLSRKGYLRIVMQVIISTARLNEDDRRKLAGTELLYGLSGRGVYGVCLFDRWYRDGVRDVIQVSAFFGESLLEKWVTIGHELGHVLAGRKAGHGAKWKEAARTLGLIDPKARGSFQIDDLDPDLVARLQAIPLPTDGQPICDGPTGIWPRPEGGCTVGIGTREGTSRGPGSGSRLRLWLCDCKRPKRVRIASDDFRARCLECFSLFRPADGETAPCTALVKVGGPSNEGSVAILPDALELYPAAACAPAPRS